MPTPEELIRNLENICESYARTLPIIDSWRWEYDVQKNTTQTEDVDIEHLEKKDFIEKFHPTMISEDGGIEEIPNDSNLSGEESAAQSIALIKQTEMEQRMMPRVDQAQKELDVQYLKQYENLVKFLLETPALSNKSGTFIDALAQFDINSLNSNQLQLHPLVQLTLQGNVALLEKLLEAYSGGSKDLEEPNSPLYETFSAVGLIALQSAVNNLQPQVVKTLLLNYPKNLLTQHENIIQSWLALTISASLHSPFQYLNLEQSQRVKAASDISKLLIVVMENAPIDAIDALDWRDQRILEGCSKIIHENQKSPDGSHKSPNRR